MKKVFFTLLLILSVATVGFAGNGKTKALKGQVIDESGSPVVGAKVVVKGLEEVVYTDFDGEFVFSKVSSSTYQINVSMVSFEESISTIDIQSRNQGNFSITLEAK